MQSHTAFPNRLAEEVLYRENRPDQMLGSCISLLLQMSDSLCQTKSKVQALGFRHIQERYYYSFRTGLMVKKRLSLTFILTLVPLG